MPQITLKLSSNIDPKSINFPELFKVIHQELSKIPNLDIKSCQSGLIQEAYSYIGIDNPRATKILLEILWLENPERAVLKKDLAHNLMFLLNNKLKPIIESQNLIYKPRIRIGNLGLIEQDYLIAR